jgi:hypothetical protein
LTMISIRFFAGSEPSAAAMPSGEGDGGGAVAAPGTAGS